MLGATLQPIQSANTNSSQSIVTNFNQINNGNMNQNMMGTLDQGIMGNTNPGVMGNTNLGMVGNQFQGGMMGNQYQGGMMVNINQGMGNPNQLITGNSNQLIMGNIYNQNSNQSSVNNQSHGIMGMQNPTAVNKQNMMTVQSGVNNLQPTQLQPNISNQPIINSANFGAVTQQTHVSKCIYYSTKSWLV